MINITKFCMGEQSLQSINKEPKHPLAKPTPYQRHPSQLPPPTSTTATTTRGRQSARGVACWLVCQKSQKKGPRTRVAEKGRRVRGMFWSPEPVLCSQTHTHTDTEEQVEAVLVCLRGGRPKHKQRMFLYHTQQQNTEQMEIYFRLRICIKY